MNTLRALRTFGHSVLSRGVVLSQMRGEAAESPKPLREAFLSRTGYVEPTATAGSPGCHMTRSLTPSTLGARLDYIGLGSLSLF